MPDFTMTKYYHRYQEAVANTGRLRAQVENLRSALASGFGDEETLEELQAVEEAYKAAQAEADDLHCLATYGKHRAAGSCRIEPGERKRRRQR